MKADATGLRVLVTAGATGIGLAIARTFFDNGARVFICDIDPAALEAFRRAQPAIGATLADVAKLDDVERMFAEAGRFLGGLDVLVNNAGIAGPTAKIEDIQPSDWERTIAVNLNGMYYCARLAMPLIKAAGGGSIINLSSVAGRLGFALRTPYSASKWAVVGLTKSLAIEAGPGGVRVNAIQPGVVEGDRIDRVIDAKARANKLSFDEQKQRFLATVSMRTTVSAQDIANMALFLATDAGKHVSGQALSVCGNVEHLV